MAKKAIIFDLFGTLTCTTSPELIIIKKWKQDPKIHPALQRAVCGQKFQNWESYLDKVVAAAGIENNVKNRAAVRKIVESEAQKGLKNVFRSAKKVLQRLKQESFVLGFVSNSYPGSREILEKSGLAHFFKKSATIFSYEVGVTKQSTKIYGLCLNALGVPAENIVMVGDSLTSDILMSQKATNGKIKGILISRNPRSEARKAGCLIVSSLANVPKAVEELAKPMQRRKPKRHLRKTGGKKVKRKL